MKVLLLNGSPNANGCTFTALSEVEKVLRNHDIETELFQIGKKPVAGCIACRKCKEGAPCIFDDGVNELAARLDEFDAIVVGAPVYYAGLPVRQRRFWTAFSTVQERSSKASPAPRSSPAAEAAHRLRLTA